MTIDLGSNRKSNRINLNKIIELFNKYDLVGLIIKRIQFDESYKLKQINS